MVDFDFVVIYMKMIKSMICIYCDVVLVVQVWIVLYEGMFCKYYLELKLNDGD